MDWLARQTMLIGERGTKKLAGSRVAVLGLGGVGGACCEALVRAGVGALLVVDFDTIESTNLNRQLFATTATLGQKKTDAARARLLEINPVLSMEAMDLRYAAEHESSLFAWSPDFVVDAIDSVSAKLDLAGGCARRGVPLLSSMGTGNRLDASRFTIGDIAETAGCGCALARVMRRELKKRGIDSLTVLYSTAETIMPGETGATPGSVSFVPPVAGLLMAGYVINHIIDAPPHGKSDGKQ